MSAWQGKGEAWGADGVLKASGMFEVGEELGPSGKYTLSAMVFGEHVIGSPLEVSVCPAASPSPSPLFSPPSTPSPTHALARD